MKKIRESKMLEDVRRWRKKAYKAQKGKSVSEKTKNDKEIADQINLPLIRTRKVGTV